MTKKIVARKCSLKDCSGNSFTKGYCQNHYYRLRKHGDVNVVLRSYGEGATPELNFWSRVAITADIEKCWEWKICKNPQGYGRIKWKGKQRQAHRVAFEIFYKREPVNMVRHFVCDNTGCCNPHHLLEGTAKDNAADKVRHGRHLHGEKHPRAKLTEKDVIGIRALYPQMSIKKIAKRFNIGETTIAHIVRRENWKHI